MPIYGRIVKLVGSGIGLARESYIHHQESKSKAPVQTSSTEPGPSTTEAETVNPPEYVETTDEHAEELIKSGKAIPVDEDDGYSTDEDEEEWRLDEAAEHIDPPSYEESEAAENVESKWVRNVLQVAPPVSGQRGRLPMPVVLPQRRPRAKARGFVRAYSPVLDDCALDQKTFLTFLNSFHEASKASKAWNVIFLGATVAGFAPEMITQIVTTAVQVAAGTAIEIQSRYRANAFLNEMNEKLFKPRGLYAVVMAYKPNATKPISAGDFDAKEMIARYDQSTGSAWKDKARQLRTSSGKTYNDLEIGEVAPLMYPALEDAAADPTKASKWKAAQKFLGDYGDKRAQAVYQAQNPGSKLAGPEPEFKSRYSDPNHPANNGTILSLITGGGVQPFGRRRARRERRAARRAEIGVPKSGKAIRKEKRQKEGGIIKRALREDIAYLMIVNMPSEEDLAAARVKLSQQQSH